MRGGTITIISRHANGTLPSGETIWETGEETVDNVLVIDGAQNNLTDSIRPDGIEVARTLYMPRSWVYHSLRGAQVKIGECAYTVIGDPKPAITNMTPTGWNVTVEVKTVEG